MLKLTRKDICSALQVPEHRIRTWMVREPFRSRSTAARKARTFDATDLMLLAIAQTLEDQYKLRGEGLDNVLPVLSTFLRRPQHTYAGLLFINVRDWSVEDASSDTYLEPGLLIDVLPDQERVTRYLGLTPAQAELALGLLPMKRVKG
mgnify:CR=1 FL=1